MHDTSARKVEKSEEDDSDFDDDEEDDSENEKKSTTEKNDIKLKKSNVAGLVCGMREAIVKEHLPKYEKYLRGMITLKEPWIKE